jgi:hypothetical protein
VAKAQVGAAVATHTRASAVDITHQCSSLLLSTQHPLAPLLLKPRSNLRHCQLCCPARSRQALLQQLPSLLRLRQLTPLLLQLLLELQQLLLAAVDRGVKLRSYCCQVVR